MKKEYRIFFAIPFDSATKNMYDCICSNIVDNHPNITTIIGNKVIGPSPEYSKIETFKLQNRELNRQFVDQILKADIVIADLTNNNPNVHFELGIAITYNKNIFRVTGRSLKELGFDIQNLEIHQYKSKGDLETKIEKYLELFFKIKELPLSKESGDLYYKEKKEIPLIGLQNINYPLAIHSTQNYLKMKDGAIKVEFKINQILPGEDNKLNWFGIYFRTLESDILIGSNLLYVRKNGSIEVAKLFRKYDILGTWPYGLEISENKKMILEAEFDNNYIKGTLLSEDGKKEFELKDKTLYQRFGNIILAAWGINAKVTSVEMVSRDTIEWDYEKYNL